MAPRRRAPISTSTSSAASRPARSLSSRKPSTSTRATVSGRSWRWARATSSVRRSRKARWLGRPVSASIAASVSSRARSSALATAVAMRSAYSCRRSSAPGANSCGSVATTIERAPHRGAGAHRARPGARSGARRRVRSRAMASPQRRRSSRLPGTHLDGGVGVVGPVLVVGPAAEDGHAVGVLEADDGRAVGAQQVPGVRARRARRSRSGGEPAATAVATRRSEACSSVIRRCVGLELARPARGAGQQLAPGHDDAADQAVDRHDDDELAREVALDGVAVVEERAARARRRRPASRPAPGAAGRRTPRRRRRTTGSRAPASRCPR